MALEVVGALGIRVPFWVVALLVGAAVTAGLVEMARRGAPEE